jgi:hypothetical protein
MTINKIRRVNEALNKIIDKDLPAINKQMEDLPNWRRSLDVAILKALEIDNEDQILEKLAASLKSILS